MVEIDVCDWRGACNLRFIRMEGLLKISNSKYALRSTQNNKNFSVDQCAFSFWGMTIWCTMLSSKVMLQLLLLIWWLMVVVTSWERRKSSFFLVHWIHIEPSLGHPWEPSHVQVFLCFSGDKSACLLKDYPRVFHILSFPTFSLACSKSTEIEERMERALLFENQFSTWFKAWRILHVLQASKLRKPYFQVWSLPMVSLDEVTLSK